MLFFEKIITCKVVAVAGTPFATLQKSTDIGARCFCGARRPTGSSPATGGLVGTPPNASNALSWLFRTAGISFCRASRCRIWLSKVLALCTKRLPEDWQEHFGYRPLLAVGLPPRLFDEPAASCSVTFTPLNINGLSLIRKGLPLAVVTFRRITSSVLTYGNFST